jgi:hypothetical protein
MVAAALTGFKLKLLRCFVAVDLDFLLTCKFEGGTFQPVLG